MADQQETVPFETFVRSSLTELSKCMQRLNTENSKQTEQIEQLTKTVNKHSKYLSKIESHDEQINSLTKTVVAQSKDVTELKSSDGKIQKKLDEQIRQNKQLEKELKSTKKSVSQFENLCMDLQAEVHLLATRAKMSLDPFDDIDSCLVVVNLLPVENEDVDLRALDLIAAVLPDATPKVVKAIRLQPRTKGKAGIIKLALETKDVKIRILRAKGKLSNHKEYSQVWIHPCKTHGERMNENNMRHILKLIPEGQNFRVNNYGRVTEVTAKPSGPVKPNGPVKRRRVVSGENTELQMRLRGCEDDGTDMEAVIEEEEEPEDVDANDQIADENNAEN
jgi:myosin heavy subunit